LTAGAFSRDLKDDPRWRRFNARGWVCPECGAPHQGIFDLACAKPEAWTGSEDKVPNAEVRHSTHFLSEDFCILENEHFFVRCVLSIPIVGSSGESFGYGVWSTLSKKNFDIYVDGFDKGDYEKQGPWFGWFSSGLKGYPDTLSLKCHVHPRHGRERPLVELEDVGHPLVHEQREGISFDRLLEIYALYGHDIRQTLAE
jgi:hypothetical protein